jgi:hypothetical protein
MTSTSSDEYLRLDPDHAIDLLALLDLTDDVLRHGGHDLREDITDRYHPGMHTQLLRSLQDHAGLLRHAITTGRTSTRS